jgi:hypothetical protein
MIHTNGKEHRKMGRTYRRGDVFHMISDMIHNFFLRSNRICWLTAFGEIAGNDRNPISGAIPGTLNNGYPPFEKMAMNIHSNYKEYSTGET